MTSDVEQAGPIPVVRVVDASLEPHAGPVRVVLSGVGLNVRQLASAIANGGGNASVVDGRIEAVALVNRLIDAAGRLGGADLAGPFGDNLRAAVRSWQRAPSDLLTTAAVLPLSRRPCVMGIVNVTPDSFSDGGEYASTEEAVAHGRQLALDGADIIDVGGESTRPGADPVAAYVEAERVVPVIRALAADGLVVSVDTTKAEVAEAAIDAGAAIVNDVSAATSDPAMLSLLASRPVAFVAMHAQGNPQSMQNAPSYADVVAEVFEFLVERISAAGAAGLGRQRIIVDPGIGFGKNVAHNLALMGRLRDLRSLGCPLLIGASRKSVLGAVTGVERPADRLAGSLAAAVLAVNAGASIVRVHDVAQTVEALRVASAVRVGEPVAWLHNGTEGDADG